MELKQYEEQIKKKKNNGTKEELLKERDESIGIQSMKMSLKSVHKGSFLSKVKRKQLL